VIVSLIVAMDEQRGIGKAGALPWRLSSDLKRFRELTMGHHIIVGRKTFESIGKPLPGRQMIVVTRNESFNAGGCFVTHSVDAAIELARARGETEVFVCGGSDIYGLTIEQAGRIYLTIVHAQVAADTFFPAFESSEWVEKSSSYHPADEKNEYASTFRVLESKGS